MIHILILQQWKCIVFNGAGASKEHVDDASLLLQQTQIKLISCKFWEIKVKIGYLRAGAPLRRKS